MTGDIAEGFTNLYREDVDGPMNLRPLTEENESTLAFLELFLPNEFLGGDSNFDRIFLSSAQQLLPGTSPSMRNIYEWNEGTLRVAGRLPDGSIPAGGSEAAIVEPGSPMFQNTIAHDSVSTDGSRLLFFASLGGPNQQLLMRKDHTSTTWVS